MDESELRTLQSAYSEAVQASDVTNDKKLVAAKAYREGLEKYLSKDATLIRELLMLRSISSIPFENLLSDMEKL